LYFHGNKQTIRVISDDCSRIRNTPILKKPKHLKKYAGKSAKIRWLILLNKPLFRNGYVNELCKDYKNLTFWTGFERYLSSFLETIAAQPCALTQRKHTRFGHG
jgi:hypothetical protein